MLLMKLVLLAVVCVLAFVVLPQTRESARLRQEPDARGRDLERREKELKARKEALDIERAGYDVERRRNQKGESDGGQKP